MITSVTELMNCLLNAVWNKRVAMAQHQTPLPPGILYTVYGWFYLPFDVGSNGSTTPNTNRKAVSKRHGDI